MIRSDRSSTRGSKVSRTRQASRAVTAEDAQHAEAEWDMAKSGYRVLLKHPHRPNEPGKWFDVPYSAVVDQPNISGIAMVWWAPSYGIDGSMTPMWRCFIAGAGG
jgi:hypothetical protein